MFRKLKKNDSYINITWTLLPWGNIRYLFCLDNNLDEFWLINSLSINSCELIKENV